MRTGVADLVPTGSAFMLDPLTQVKLYSSIGLSQSTVDCWKAMLQNWTEGDSFVVLDGLPFFHRQCVLVIAWVHLGLPVCVRGELNFGIIGSTLQGAIQFTKIAVCVHRKIRIVFIGFMLQGVSQLAECARAVVAELVLTGSEFKLDPLSYTFFMAPVCLLVLAIGNIITWDHSVITDLAVWWPYLIPNACIAFCLNVMIAQVIKETSAVGFIITGVVKDIALVVFSSAVFHDSITSKQWLSFSVTLSGVFFWSFMKEGLPGSPGGEVLRDDVGHWIRPVPRDAAGQEADRQ